MVKSNQHSLHSTVILTSNHLVTFQCSQRLVSACFYATNLVRAGVFSMSNALWVCYISEISSFLKESTLYHANTVRIQYFNTFSCNSAYLQQNILGSQFVLSYWKQLLEVDLENSSQESIEVEKYVLLFA